MFSQSEDTLSSAYNYAWSNGSELPLEDFLKKYKPSMVQNDGTKPWIWVRGSEPSRDDSGASKAMEEASVTLKELTEKVENIKNDSSIPLRSSKKTGAKSKKEVREEAQAEATKELEAISIKHGFVSGKWLIFAPSDKVDIIWSSIAKSLVSGPLSLTSAFLAKVATSPETETPNYQHVVCIYMLDVYDKASVTEVMKILLRNHGLNLSGVKSDLYTCLGIDSKHPSGIQSTVWKISALIPDLEAKALKDAYFTELSSRPAVVTSTTTDPQVVSSSEATALPALKSRPKPKLKKKVVDDLFASESDDNEETNVVKGKAQKPPTNAIKRKTNSDEDNQKKLTSKRHKLEITS